MKGIITRLVLLCAFSGIVFAQTEVQYRVHMTGKGWQDGWSSNGSTAGTTGEKRYLEAIQMKVAGLGAKAKISYQTYIAEDKYWTDWMSKGEVSGTTGKGKALTALKIKLENANGYKVKYRIHVSGSGWQEWVNNGELASAPGDDYKDKGYSIEALEVALVAPPPPKPPTKPKM
jgi:uncharacterized protein YjdB